MFQLNEQNRMRRNRRRQKRKLKNEMRGVTEVRAKCTVGPAESVGEMIVVATFRAAMQSKHARDFAATQDWGCEIWFVERDDTGLVLCEHRTESVPSAADRRRARELEFTIAEAQAELDSLKRMKL